MGRGVVIACCLLVMPVAGVGGAAALGQASSSSVQLDNGARLATARLLARSITVDLNDARLEDVITFIRDYSGATVEPVWSDDQDAGLDKDQRISISVNGVSVLTLIERVLEKARTDLSPATWQFALSGGGLEIGPRAALNKHAYLRIYDIQDMLFQIPDFADAPTLDLDQVLNQGSQGGGGGGSVFGDTPEGGGTGPSQDALAQQLIDIITENIEPSEWQDNGGSGGTIRHANGALLVRAPDYMHRQLGGYPFAMGGRPRAAVAATPATPASTPAPAPKN